PGAAVIVRSLLRAVALAAETGFALKQWLVLRLECQFQRKIPGANTGSIKIFFQIKNPVIHPYARIPFPAPREVERGARGALVVAQAAVLRIGECGVREDDLP